MLVQIKAYDIKLSILPTFCTSCCRIYTLQAWELAWLASGVNVGGDVSRWTDLHAFCLDLEEIEAGFAVVALCGGGSEATQAF